MARADVAGAGWSDILHSLAEVLVTVRTPLVLVAFFVGAVVAITWIVEKQRGRDRTRIAIWGMGIAGSLIVVAILGYLYEQVLGSDIKSYGTVRSTDGRQIPGAMVSISGGVPPQITNLYGQFNFVIPKSLQAASYEVRTQADGFEPFEKRLTQAELRDINVVLMPASGDPFSVALGTRVLISHFLGEPISGFSLKVANKTKKTITVSDLSLDVISPQGQSHSLLLGAIAASERDNLLPSPPVWPVQPNEATDYYLWWARIPWQVLGLSTVQDLRACKIIGTPRRGRCPRIASASS